MDGQTREDFFPRLDVTLRRLARPHVGADAAQDLSQRVQTLLVQKGLHLRLAAEELTRWAGKALGLLLRNHRRAAARTAERAVALDEVPEELAAASSVANPYEYVLSQERRALIARALARLGPAERRLLQMLMAGHTRAEIMAALGLTEARTLSCQLWRARERFREALRREGLRV